MIGRLIYKLILALSLLLGIGLLVLWARTRHSDLLVSGASAGTYRELRLGQSQLGVTLMTTWPDDEPVRWGRPPRPQFRASALKASGIGFVALRGSGSGQSLALLDGAAVTMQPNPSTWWPPTRSSGSAMMNEVSLKHVRATSQPTLTFTGTVATIAGGNVQTSAVTVRPTSRPGSFTGTVLITGSTGTGPTTTATAPVSAVRVLGPSTLPAGFGSGSINIVPPSLSSATPTTTQANELAKAFQESSELRFRNPIKPPSIAATPALRIGGGTLFVFPTYQYERYALPVWAVAAIVLIPVWWAILLTLLRWRRRQSRRKRGLCERCGYDLRGSPTGGACPECGAATDSIPAPPSGEQLMARLK